MLYWSRIGSRVPRVRLCGSAIFILPVWPEMAVGGLFSPVIRVLRGVFASRLARSATGRQPMTGILLPVRREVNIPRRRSPGVLCCRSTEASDCWPASSDGSICGFCQIGSGCLSTGSSFARPEVASSGRDTATPMTSSVNEFFVSTPSPLLLSIADL